MLISCYILNFSLESPDQEQQKELCQFYHYEYYWGHDQIFSTFLMIEKDLISQFAVKDGIDEQFDPWYKPDGFLGLFRLL